MADYTIASSVNIETGNKMTKWEYCVEQVISFQQQTNVEKVFDEVVYPEELTLKKMDLLAVTVSDKSYGHQTFQPDYEEPIQVVQEFDPQIEICNLYRS